jgi:subtilase family serine protease
MLCLTPSPLGRIFLIEEAKPTEQTDPENQRGKTMIRKLGIPLLAIVTLLSVTAIAGYAQSLPALTHHTRSVVLSGAAPAVGHLPSNQSMRLVLSLPLHNQTALDGFLRDVYDPANPSYRHFLTVEQFTERFGPTQSDYDAVIRYAKTNGFKVAGVSRNRMNIDVTGSVGTIERAFHVNMGIYQKPTENRTFYAPDREPTFDSPVRLWHVSGLDNFSIPRPALTHRDTTAPEKAHSNATTGSCPQASFCGSDMRAAYYEGTTLTGAGQSVGLFEYAGTDLADLKTYYKNVNQTNNVPITLLSVDGTPTSCLASQDCDDTEQTIDMTQALGMAPGLSSLVMYVGSLDSAIFNAMATANPLNAQLSCSWYWDPVDPKTLNPIFEEFSAQGQNLFDAAGDDGKWPPAIWPADNAYLVSVGGTDLNTTGPAGDWASETAWADGGGGISPNKIPIPSWQVATAAQCSDCSQVYRNGPDVSANANFTFYVCADQTTCSENYYGGTSFAAPMWAGYLALANEQLLLNGGTSTLGFIDPTLYTIGLGSSYDTDFHDITSGSNGYQATVGYDLATGWGSPNGAALINALAGTPTGSFSLAATPKAAKIAQGAKAPFKVVSTITGSFDSAVTISASGLPKGVTAAYLKNPIPAPGSGTAELQLTASSTATTGIATITITGTGGGLTETTTIKIDITKAAN